jgi:two-component system LytT family response regulator
VAGEDRTEAASIRVTLRVVVADDEELGRERVGTLVRQHSALELVGEAEDGAAALDLICSARPDLAFLDIQMPELDGFEVVNALEDEMLPAIVFVTAYDQYAIRAFDVDAIDYVLKPVTPERFDAAVRRVISRLERRDDTTLKSVDALVRAVALQARTDREAPTQRFVARRGNKHYFVRVEEIDWAEAAGNYVRLHTGEKSHLVRETMSGLESRLDTTRFVRIHRSAIVAIDRIQTIESREQGEYLVTTTRGVRLVSSRGYAEQVRKLLR